jgi:hypothetical protein
MPRQNGVQTAWDGPTLVPEVPFANPYSNIHCGASQFARERSAELSENVEAVKAPSLFGTILPA